VRQRSKNKQIASRLMHAQSLRTFQLVGAMERIIEEQSKPVMAKRAVQTCQVSKNLTGLGFPRINLLTFFIKTAQWHYFIV
jgi:hypothetical protein